MAVAMAVPRRVSGTCIIIQPYVRAEMAPTCSKREARLSRTMNMLWMRNMVRRRGPITFRVSITAGSGCREGVQRNW